jgi:tetratricopeptide (TPR) repeat protein
MRRGLLKTPFHENMHTTRLGTRLGSTSRQTVALTRVWQIKHVRNGLCDLKVRAENLPDKDVIKYGEPNDARSAIAIGLTLTDAKEWEEAQKYFERALELPGTGIKRFRDKPPQISDGEKMAALYNIACCQSQLGQPENIQNGLIALAGCLESGYDNFNQLRSDPDLENLRKDDKFEGLLKRFEKPKGFLGLFNSL